MTLSRFLAQIALLAFLILPLPATADSLQADTEATLQIFFAAVAADDDKALAAVLAPEFQIMRSSGTGYERAGYLERGASTVKIVGTPEIDDLVITREGDIVVARYFLVLEESIDGEHVSHRAPRLSVLRRGGEGWLIVAHANFASATD